MAIYLDTNIDGDLTRDLNAIRTSIDRMQMVKTLEQWMHGYVQ